MNFRKVRAVARKEYYHLIRDFRSLYLAFVLPLLLILLFGYALSLDVDRVKTLVVDHDRTPESRRLIRDLSASRYFDILGTADNTAALSAALDRSRITLGIVIPPGWHAGLAADRETSLQVIIDGSDPNYAGLTRAYVNAFFNARNRKALLSFLDRTGRPAIAPPVEARVRVWFNEDLESRRFIVPGIIAIVIMIVGAMMTSLVIAREHENGTMETIRSMPLSRGAFLAGKAIPYFFIGLIDVLVAVLMGQILFGVVIKTGFWLMLLGTALYLSVALMLGLLISALARNQLLANQAAIVVTYLPSLLLSDFVFPVSSMPPVLQHLTRIIPATYFIDILNGLYLRGIGFCALWKSFGMLGFMFLVLGAMNVLVLKREGM